MKVTLENLHEAGAQDVFNQVRDHLLKQMKVSRINTSETEPNKCAYFGYNGSTCAAGCLIGNEDIAKHFDSLPESYWESLVYSQKIVPDFHADLIIKLQGVHDYSEPDEWQKNLIAVAKSFNLVF